MTDRDLEEFEKKFKIKEKEILSDIEHIFISEYMGWQLSEKRKLYTF